MAQSRLWFSRSERHNYLTGIQKFLPGSDFQKTAGTIRSRTHPTRSWDHAALQGSSAKRPYSATGRSHCAAESRCRGDQLFRIKDKHYFGACVAARTNRRPHRPCALRAVIKWTLPPRVSSEDRKHRRDDSSGNRAGMLEFV